ncbi:E3 ubiquitin- ligase MBR2-like [Olea europaea subsp. europaea]|uniref:RING-type E3 ubiquitin transferase n=1 Tax=Olea europaea subsp. europaea TaxID=158383 RepID=A0A8S0VKH1_OLEEU|nr:E3 ubiquitin- ligase MBR2-like [Olea europaea subsp. europaea]
MSRMQGERVLDSFPDTIDLNQGSFSNNDTVDHSAAWDDLLNPIESQLPNYMLSSSEGNISCVNAVNSHTRSVSGWDVGESSSLANNLQNEVPSDVSRMRHGWSSSFNAFSGADARTEDWSFESANVVSAGYGGNQSTGRFPSMQNYGSNLGSWNMNYGYNGQNDDQRGIEAGQSPTFYKFSQSESRQIPSFHASSSTRGTSSGILLENDDTPGSSLDTWGLSCKRKDLEGTSRQFNPGGSSSTGQPMENIMRHSVPFRYTAPGSLSISSDPGNLTRASHSEQINPSGVGLNRVTSGILPSLSVPGIRESPARSFGVRSNLGHRSVSFDAPICSGGRHSSVYAAQPPSRHISNIDSSEVRPQFSFPTNPSNLVNQSHTMHMSEARRTLPFPWNGSPNSRSGSSSSSLMFTGERNSAVNEDVSFRNPLRNNAEFPSFVSTPETRNMLQDQIDWSFVPETSGSSRNHSSGSRIGPSSVRTFPPVWMPHQNPTTQSQQTSSEFGLRAPVPVVESDTGIRRSHLSAMSSASVATSSQARNQSDQRSASLMAVPGGDISGWHALAADSDGRQILIRHFLHAMRRGVHNLRSEDYMLLDPFINGFAEMNDRHGDMRLDIDNMSYEELLALEERIGNVSTGLSEEKILRSMEQRKYEPFGSSPNSEPCCICQEDYIAGDGIGILDCRHEFHTKCIKQWLKLKNLCPICKTTALDT